MGKRKMKRIAIGALLLAIGSVLTRDVPTNRVYISASAINVRDYGARGNGIHDDTDAIQRALDAAADSGGGRVYFPRGTYMVNPTRTLHVSSNTVMYGEGARSVIKASKTDFGWEMVRVTGSKIEMNQLTLDGNNQVNRVLVISGGSQNILMSEIVVANATHSKDPSSDYYTGVVSGIVVYGDTQNITIDKVEVKNIQAIHLSEGGMVARGIYLTTTWNSNEAPAQDVTISDSYIHHIGPADDGDGLYVEDPAMDQGEGTDTNVQIVNNRFNYCAKRAIKIYADGVSVADNHIQNSYLNNNYYQGVNKGQLAPDMYSAISVYGSNNTVSGNVIEGKGSFYGAIEVSAGEVVRKISVKNNKIVMGSSSNIQGTTSIRLGNIADFTIANNNLRHGERGIWTWQNAQNGVIASNTIVMKQGGGIDLTTYLSGYVVENVQVLNNKIMAKHYDIRQNDTNRNIKIQRG